MSDKKAYVNGVLKMNWKKKCVAVLLSVAVVFTSATGVIASPAAMETDGRAVSVLKGSSVYANEWDRYSTNYFYNLLSDEERAFWDEMDGICLEYLTGTKNLEKYKSYYVIDAVSTQSISISRLQSLAIYFIYSNPQYYFLQNNFFVFQRGDKNGIMLCAYSAFADGKKRAVATADFQKKIEAWSVAAAGCATDEEKARALHDIVCQNTSYNHEAIDGNGNVIASSEDAMMTQSAYSAMCMGKSVCAGYTKAFAILCNGMGIDALVISSPVHAWNKVRINDSWYNIDCTWDDTDKDSQPMYYEYFARSDYMNQYELREGYTHFEEDMWKGLLPECTLDSNSSVSAPGTFPEITEQTSEVQITVEEYSEKDSKTGNDSVVGYKVSMNSDTPDAKIYYTIDGTIPAQACAKSYLYTGPFLVYDVPAVMAIAVCDQKKNSSLAVSDACSGLSYEIVYELNGGKNSKKNPKTYSYWDSDIALANPTKTGYKFGGWYTDEQFTSEKVKTIVSNNVGTIHLYAKWTPIKYKIKFSGNGATSGEMKTKTCKYGTSYKLPSNTFRKKGYTFVGWNTKKDGTGKTYKDSKKIKNLSSKSGKTITLYAQWEKK